MCKCGEIHFTYACSKFVIKCKVFTVIAMWYLVRKAYGQHLESGDIDRCIWDSIARKKNVTTTRIKIAFDAHKKVIRFLQREQRGQDYGSEWWKIQTTTANKKPSNYRTSNCLSKCWKEGNYYEIFFFFFIAWVCIYKLAASYQHAQVESAISRHKRQSKRVKWDWMERKKRTRKKM